MAMSCGFQSQRPHHHPARQHRNRTGTDVGDRCWASCNAVSRAGARHRKESLMRILPLTILAVGMASAAPSPPAQTYDPNYPVCMQIYQSWKDYYFECTYTSLAQCNMSASGQIGRASCRERV